MMLTSDCGDMFRVIRLEEMITNDTETELYADVFNKAFLSAFVRNSVLWIIVCSKATYIVLID